MEEVGIDLDTKSWVEFGLLRKDRIYLVEHHKQKLRGRLILIHCTFREVLMCIHIFIKLGSPHNVFVMLYNNNVI